MHRHSDMHSGIDTHMYRDTDTQIQRQACLYTYTHTYTLMCM